MAKSINICDIIKVLAYFRVYGLNIYSKNYMNINQGKNNMLSYFKPKYG